MKCLMVSLVVFACAVQNALGQEFNCSTVAGSLAFLRNGARTDPGCYIPLINLLTTGQIPSGIQIEAVCTESCAGVVLDFLRSTEKCRNDKQVQNRAYFLQSELCAYKDGEGKPETSCALQNQTGIFVSIDACFIWWLQNGNACPPLSSGAPPGTPPCADALQMAVDEYGCCLNNVFGSEKYIEEITAFTTVNLARQGVIVPSGYEADITDPELFAACNVALPPECETVVPTSDSALGPAATPLVVTFLLSFLAQLFT